MLTVLGSMRLDTSDQTVEKYMGGLYTTHVPKLSGYLAEFFQTRGAGSHGNLVQIARKIKSQNRSNHLLIGTW